MILAFDIDGASDDFAQTFSTAALRRELLLRPIGATVYFMPPYTTSDDEFALLVERTIDVLDAC
jgi:adenosylmethionine---8-amino-7-oxononanoate aminotransferase